MIRRDFLAMIGGAVTLGGEAVRWLGEKTEPVASSPPAPLYIWGTPPLIFPYEFYDVEDYYFIRQEDSTPRLFRCQPITDQPRLVGRYTYHQTIFGSPAKKMWLGNLWSWGDPSSSGSRPGRLIWAGGGDV